MEPDEKDAHGVGSAEDDLDDDNGVPQENIEAPEYRKVKGLSLKDILRVDDGNVKLVRLSLPKFKKLAKLYPDHVVRFTQKIFLRIYPENTRNPLLAWTHGAQMVAFHMQVKVYMGDGWFQDFKKTHFDTNSPPDFYARVGIAGVPADDIMKRTGAVKDKWIPCWGDEFSFPLTVPELALLCVEVRKYDMSEKDDFGGQTCLPVAELKTGIRAISLFNKNGEKYQSVRLLMRLEFVS